MIVPTTISRDRQAVIKSMSGFESSGDGSGMNDSKNRHIKGGTKDNKGREMIIYEKRRGTARRMIRRSRRRQMRKCRTRMPGVKMSNPWNISKRNNVQLSVKHRANVE